MIKTEWKQEQKVLLVRSSIDRWIIRSIQFPNLAWSGTYWVEHKEGIGFDVTIRGFGTIKAATAYALSYGFVVVGIEQNVG